MSFAPKTRKKSNVPPMQRGNSTANLNGTGAPNKSFDLNKKVSFTICHLYSF